MSSLELQASSGLATIAWHSINWAACQRRVRSLQRRIVQAVQAGLWRKVKRLSYLLAHSFAARVLSFKRVTENPGKKTPGVEGEVWDTAEQKADAILRIGQWRNCQPRPLKRIYIPKRIDLRRPLSIPAIIDRARQALHLQALQPIAETQADPNSYDFRPKRQCADAIDQCFKTFLSFTNFLFDKRNYICSSCFLRLLSRAQWRDLYPLRSATAVHLKMEESVYVGHQE